MKNILFDDDTKYANCTFCEGIVYADNPICSECGLEMTTEGIDKLSKIQEENADILSELYHLKYMSSILIFITLFGSIYAYLTDIKLFFYIYVGIFSILTPILNFINWNQKYELTDFDSEDDEIIRKLKKQILFFLISNLVLGVILYLLVIR